MQAVIAYRFFKMILLHNTSKYPSSYNIFFHCSSDLTAHLFLSINVYREATRFIYLQKLRLPSVKYWQYLTCRKASVSRLLLWVLYQNSIRLMFLFINFATRTQTYNFAHLKS